jgi:DNA-binding phage protein
VGVQPKLPGTLPSPADARKRLIQAKRQLTACRQTLGTLTEAAKVAREQMSDAEDERATVAADYEDSDSPEAAAAYLRAVTECRRRAEHLRGARLAVREAKKATKTAERARDAADEDLLAIAEGRRGDV